MRKLKLNVDTLQVDSFESLPAGRRLGTVAAQESTVDPLYLDPYGDSGGSASGGVGYTVGTCIGPTFCCPATWNCPVINTNTASRIVSAEANPCTC